VFTLAERCSHQSIVTGTSVSSILQRGAKDREWLAILHDVEVLPGRDCEKPLVNGNDVDDDDDDDD